MYSLRDLSVWYPLLPGVDAASGVPKLVLDMRILVLLPATNVDEQDSFNLYMSSLTTTEMTVNVVMNANTIDTLTVPCYIGRDSRPNIGQSYVILDEAVNDSTDPLWEDAPLKIHPDCVLFRKARPKLYIHDRGAVSKTDNVNGVDGRVTPGDMPAYSMSTLSIENGHNIAVEYEDSAIRFTGGGGAGKGLYTIPPYSDLSTYELEPSHGLRSINGISGNVQMSGVGDVLLTAAVEDKDITLTIAPRAGGVA